MTVAFVSAVQQRRQSVAKEPEAGTQAMISAVSIAQNSGKGGKGEDEHDEKTPKGRWSGTLGSLACDLFCTFMQMLICIDGISRGDINGAIC